MVTMGFLRWLGTVRPRGLATACHRGPGSRRGRPRWWPSTRLEGRLRAGGLDIGVARWLLLCTGATAVLVGLGLGIGVPPSLGVPLAIGATRLGADRVLERARRRHQAAIRAAAPALARGLYAALVAGASPLEAMARASGGMADEHPRLVTLLRPSLTLAMCGSPSDRALLAACDRAGTGPGRTALARVAAAFAVVTRLGGDPECLARIARVVEAEGQVAAQAEGIVAECRATAMATPAVAAVAGLLLVLSSPRGLAVLSTTGVGPALALGALGALSGVGWVRRRTAVP